MKKGLLKEFSEEYLNDPVGCQLKNDGIMELLNTGYTFQLLNYVYKDITGEKTNTKKELLNYLLSNNFDIIYWHLHYIVKFEGDMIVYVKGFDNRPAFTNLKDIDNWFIKQNKL